MKKNINVLSLFDGMSCGRIALQRAGIKVDNYFSSEIDKYSIQVADANYPQDSTNRLGNVLDLTDKQLLALPKIDLLIGGSPCQGFSFAGKKKGASTECGIEITTLTQYLELKKDKFEFNGQSYLFWEFVRIKELLKPQYYFLENVRISKEWLPMFNKAMEVEPIRVNSKKTVPQNRERFYWTNIINDIKIEDSKRVMCDILEVKQDNLEKISKLQTVNEKGEKIPNIASIGQAKRIYSTSGISPCLNRGWVPYIYDGKKSRKLTAEECEQLQDVPKGYTESVKKSERHSMLGNGWTVSIITIFFKNIK